MTDNDLIGSREAGEILGVTKRTVSRLAACGALTIAHKADGGYVGIHLYERGDVLRLKAERDAAKASA